MLVVDSKFKFKDIASTEDNPAIVQRQSDGYGYDATPIPQKASTYGADVIRTLPPYSYGQTAPNYYREQNTQSANSLNEIKQRYRPHHSRHKPYQAYNPMNPYFTSYGRPYEKQYPNNRLSRPRDYFPQFISSSQPPISTSTTSEPNKPIDEIPPVNTKEPRRTMTTVSRKFPELPFTEATTAFAKTTKTLSTAPFIPRSTGRYLTSTRPNVVQKFFTVTTIPPFTTIFGQPESTSNSPDEVDDESVTPISTFTETRIPEKQKNLRNFITIHPHSHSVTKGAVSSSSPFTPSSRHFSTTPANSPTTDTFPPISGFIVPIPPHLYPVTVTSRSSSQPRYTTTAVSGEVPNRLRGKPKIVCVEDGIEFEITTLFPFNGQIFAHDHNRIPECVFTFNNAATPKVKLPYDECGVRNAGPMTGKTQYHMEIMVIFEQKDGKTTIHSYIAQCEQQKVHYQKSSVPRRIEEALEEFIKVHFRLHLVPARLEQKAPVPECIMRILTEQEHSHDHEGTEVNSVDLGQPMKIEWRLVPESDAYGFHIRNCTVQDRISGEEYLVIDARGCSTDINIFGHPHYDTYHDVASVHWHAFKVPDDSQLNIRCSFEICSDIADSKSGISSCESIPSPPYCPDVISSPTNSILADINKNSLRKRSAQDNHQETLHQNVHADICIGDRNDGYCNSDDYIKKRNKHLDSITSETQRVCISSVWFSLCTGLSAWSLLVAIGVHIYCRWCRWKRKQSNDFHTSTPHVL